MPSFPAALLVVGAHYLPFVFLYGMRLFGVLAGVLVLVGVTLGLWLEVPFATGGWVGGLVLVVFAELLRRSAAAEAESESAVT